MNQNMPPTEFNEEFIISSDEEAQVEHAPDTPPPKRGKKKHKGKKHKRRKKKYTKWIGDDIQYYSSQTSHDRDPPFDVYGQSIPKQMCLSYSSPGIVFGLTGEYGYEQYVGMLQDAEGNIVVVGSNSSGKSSGIAKPTLFTWDGVLVATDIKGELSEFYKKLNDIGIKKRPYIIFDPMQPNGYCYDPFDFVSKDSAENTMSNIEEIAYALIPESVDSKDRFWIESERAILSAALFYFYKVGLSFAEAIFKILSLTVTELCEMLMTSSYDEVKLYLGEIAKMKPETMALFDREIRNKLKVFATDPHISKAFDGRSGEENCFSWSNLEKYNIFICVPEWKIEQWSGVINLLYTQLIRHLERRPDKYNPEGANNLQTLLLMDEFARFDKLNMITNAMSTLRSKNVNICLILQSLAQLDKKYGKSDRSIIMDNAQYKIVLRVGDVDTQKYFSDLIGTTVKTHHSISENYDDCMDISGYTNHTSETREPVIYPHDLAYLNDVLLFSPYGFNRVYKVQPKNMGNVLQQLTDTRVNALDKKNSKEHFVIKVEALPYIPDDAILGKAVAI